MANMKCVNCGDLTTSICDECKKPLCRECSDEGACSECVEKELGAHTSDDGDDEDDDDDDDDDDDGDDDGDADEEDED